MRAPLYAIGNVVDNYHNGPYNCHIGLILHFLTICWEHSHHPPRLESNMQQFLQSQKKMIGIEQTAENDSIDMFEQAKDWAE